MGGVATQSRHHLPGHHRTSYRAAVARWCDRARARHLSEVAV